MYATGNMALAATPKQLGALAVAMELGFTAAPPRPQGELQPEYGIKARVGQYVRPYTRAVVLDTSRRVSKGARRRYERDNGTEGALDYSAFINSKR